MDAPAAALFARVAGLELPMGDYAIFGSGPLIVRCWIEPSNDLDILCRGRAWEEALRIGDLVHLENWGIDVVEVDEGAITIGRRWAIGDFDVDDLIDTAELIEGLPFVDLRYVADYKRIADRPKDRRHLEIMERHGWAG
jgi:hypothetical protein